MRSSALRWALGIAATLALLLVLTAVCVVWLVDPSRFRPQIERQAQARFGVPLQLSGPLKWQLWPWFSIASEQGAIGAVSNALAPVSWQRLAVGARWAGLLRGEFMVDSLRVDGLQLYWRRDPGGRSNWDGLFRPPAGASGQELGITSLELRDARISVDDAVRGAQWRIEAQVTTGFHWQPATSAFTLLNCSVTARVLGAPLPSPGLTLTALSRRIDWRNEPMTLQPNVLQWRLGNAFGELAVTEPLQSSPWRGAGSVQWQTPALREWLTSLGISPPATRDRAVLQGVTARSDWRLASGVARFDALRVRLDATTLSGTLQWPLQSAALGTLDLQGDDLNLDRYLPPEEVPATPFALPVKTLQALPLQGTVSFRTLTAGGATARNARLQLETDTAASAIRSSP
jgi:AsmA protein